MIHTGLIGRLDSLEPFIEMLKDFPEILIQGKSSTGFTHRHDFTRYSVPELNRIELIEKSEALLFLEGARLSSDLLIDVIKKSKHVFISDFLLLTIEECDEIEKLMTESKSVLQIRNPFLYHPAVQWVSRNFSLPAFLDLDYSSESSDADQLLMELLLMPIQILGASPSKIRSLHLPPSSEQPLFTNIRLEYRDSSVLNINFDFNKKKNEFLLRGNSGNNVFKADIIANSIESDLQLFHNEQFNPSLELLDFFNSIRNRSAVKTGITEFSSVLKTFYEIIRRKS